MKMRLRNPTPNPRANSWSSKKIKQMGGQGDKGTRGQGEEREFNDFSIVCIISPTQINFSVYNELALGEQGGESKNSPCPLVSLSPCPQSPVDGSL
jgi:hypothetical protein